MTFRLRPLPALLLLSAAACAPHVPAGMAPLSRPSPLPLDDSDRAAVVVAFQESACTGGDSAVFLDERGHFVGSIAPGTAAVLTLPDDSSRLFVVASGDVTDIPGAALIRQQIARRPGSGVVLEIPGADTHNCRGRWSGPLIPVARLTSQAEARASAAGLTWIEPRLVQGNAWLDEYRSRVNEILGRTPDGSPDPRLTEVVPLH